MSTSIFLLWRAENAVFKAGIDGVDVHCANAYMIDRFLQDTPNQRIDEHMHTEVVWTIGIDFALETIAVVVGRVSQHKTGMWVSPRRKLFSVVTDCITARFGKKKIKLATPEVSTFFDRKSEKCYTDYPFAAESIDIGIDTEDT